MIGLNRGFYLEKTPEKHPKKVGYRVGMGMYPSKKGRVVGVGYIPNIWGQKGGCRLSGVGCQFRVQIPSRVHIKDKCKHKPRARFSYVLLVILLDIT